MKYVVYQMLDVLWPRQCSAIANRPFYIFISCISFNSIYKYEHCSTLLPDCKGVMFPFLPHKLGSRTIILANERELYKLQPLGLWLKTNLSNLQRTLQCLHPIWVGAWIHTAGHNQYMDFEVWKENNLITIYINLLACLYSLAKYSTFLSW